MSDYHPHQTVVPAFREVYPTLNDLELKEAERNLRAYLDIAFAIQQKANASDSAVRVDTAHGTPIIKERSNCFEKNNPVTP